ncbi:phage head morphogenesis protein [Oscillospiraceae bacterium OttesenSCG-928-F05]|nr:phage head morphogenesis protein [Oscillospiraceae bacterium OttesenSCG-928-F05]
MDKVRRALAHGKAMSFEEAVQFFGEKIALTPEQFHRLSEKYRHIAFTISSYTSVQMVNQIYTALLEAIEEGSTVESFKEQANTLLESNGYTGLSPRHAETIFRTNTMTAYNAGHYRQMSDPAVIKARPYWQYHAIEDDASRPSHLAMNGRVFPADSPVWDTWYPPNGYKCRCRVTSLSKRQVEERGLVVEETPPASERLPDGRFTHIHPDERFATNPGKVEFKPDLSDFPDVLREAFEKKMTEESP